MSLPRRTIHYVAQHEDRNNPFTEDHTLAAVYIKAETQRRSSRLLGIHSVYYPIQLRNWGNYTVLLDLLGLNQLKFKVNVIPDVFIIRDELEAASLKPEEFLALLRKRTDYFKSFAGENTFTLRGLLGKPPNEGLNVLQRDSTAFEETSFIFPPILKKGDISSLLGDLDSIHQTLLDDRKQLENAVGYLKESLEVVNKVITEETRNLKDSSSRIKNKLGKDLKKKKDRLKKKLSRDTSKLSDALKRKTQHLREERSKEKRRVTRLTNRRKRMRGDPKLEDVNTKLKTSRERYKELDSAIKDMEAETSKNIDKLRQDYSAVINEDKNKLKTEESKIKELLENKKKLASQISLEARGFSKQIDSMIRRKENRLKALFRLCIEEKMKETEFYIPFYVFEYNNNKYSHLPPVAVASGGGVFSRFRRILSDNLESKVDNIIGSQGLFTDGYAVSAVRALSKKSSLAQVLKGRENASNLFGSRSSLDGMMKGLVEFRRRGLINDGEYIKLQVSLVERLDGVNRE